MLDKFQWKKWILPLAVGIILWLVTPFKPAAISVPAWHLFAIFIATIIACVTKPLPMMATTLIAITIATVTGIFKMKEVAAGFGNPTAWMVAMCMFMAAGFIKSGLGKRIAYFFVKTFGKRTLGLAYALSLVETVLAIGIPSNNARVNGIMYPIIDNLSKEMGSDPKKGTQREMGSYLVFNEYEVNIVTSTMFLTGLAGNMVALGIAKTQNVNISWMQWFLAAIVPGIISLILVPFILYKIYPPKIKETPNAHAWADKKLKSLGKMTAAEEIMLVVFVLAVALWLVGPKIGIDATEVSFIAVALLLITGVINVKDMLNQSFAWNILTWLSVIMLMSQKLMTLGFFPWFSETLGSALHGVSWIWVLVILFLVYFYLHYLFPSVSTQISALYAGFLSVAIGAGVPPLMAALMLAFDGSLYLSTSSYSAGPAALLSSTGYVSNKDWWKLSAIIGIVLNIIWLGGGLLWTKIIGYW
ncbi:DASS family sodium-coupled anion symporter [Lactobacillus acetotolerans]|jgi:DASS family divalent anion:Na+ symporter|uniref:Cation transport protein n=1 Tax=Lactobacillus acetotolerans TaxID=1600 RepID=A0A0D6A308_9LACO|nr:DASS family sodium-coupled anion symporter [Lactobacillus acetotolerans]KRN41702.1 cation transporter [Lactobacillus acetotolerans DSM 20749 = JCM 3825]QFG51230.1 DASS family sodium-coupled anion symporter [Lactobacillus acetotolerans]QGV04662.1 DASS family sodium-coupled anion symporter [Lactobacillus acetotolerans]BAQ57187.1 cation transport protein [Lactobacillus acetotolerans]GGV10445.1 2-oxoglutarate translocator [Lactobacillus acetotolerans DSM 20749 = JCM 3825]